MNSGGEVAVMALMLCAFLLAWVVYAEVRGRGEGRRHQEHVGRLEDDLERARRENTALLRQVAGIDPTPEQQRADMLAQLAGGTQTTEQRQANTVGAGPVPVAPTRWEFPPDDYADDPTDLTAPLDDPLSWVGIVAPQLSWGPDEQLAAPEPVPEGEYRPMIVGMAPNENPLAELGIEPAWRED